MPKTTNPAKHKKEKKNKNSKAMLNVETVNFSSGKTCVLCVTKIPTFEKSLCHLKWLFALVNPFVFSHLKLFRKLNTLCSQCYLILCLMYTNINSDQTEGRDILSSLNSIYFSFGNSFGFPFFRFTRSYHTLCVRNKVIVIGRHADTQSTNICDFLLKMKLFNWGDQP